MDNITISMEEYKELLEIKGRYQELKEQKTYKDNISTTIYKPSLTRQVEEVKYKNG